MDHWQEKQRAIDPMPLVLIAIPMLVFLLLAFLYNSTDPTAFIIVFICFFVTLILLLALQLHVSIDQNGIAYPYFPFHFSPQSITWEDVRECRIVRVQAFSEYGGLGIRYASRKKGYIIHSKHGLEIYKKDNRIIVVSITQKEAAEKALKFFGGPATTSAV